MAPLSFAITAFVCLLQYHRVAAQKIPYVTTQAEYNTECKTCPRSLCPNVVNYGMGDEFNVTCYNFGTNIMGDRLWLKSEAGCYVTQYDVLEYPNAWSDDLRYCGPESEEQHLTFQPATLKWKTECRICPELTCDMIAYLKEDTDLELTCWYPEGQMVIDDPYWFKTTNNCYVAQIGLYEKPDISKMDNCGPIPLLEIEKHHNENGTSDVNRREAAPLPLPEPLHERDAAGTAYIINVTVGEEYAYCRSCPSDTCKTEKMYEFNEEVWLQCLVDSQTGNGTYWSQTIDFCYVKNTDFWESPEGDFYRNPLCRYFEENPDPEDSADPEDS